MKLCAAHVYWMLLFTSVLSSTLLFLIVASESIQNNKFIGPDRNQAFIEEKNATFIKNVKDRSETNSQENSNIKGPSSINAEVNDQANEDIQKRVLASVDASKENEENQFPEEIGILKESLTHRPNSSEGISDGGEQAVVLTLVKTASSLQGLTSARTDFRSKPESNGSAGVASGEQGIDEDLIGISKLLKGNESTTNETGFYEDNADSVVVVRAKQKSPSSIKLELDLEVEKQQPDELTRQNDEETEEGEPIQQIQNNSPTAAPDLNDSAARARLTGSVDDNAAVILDSIVTAGPSDVTHEEIPSFNEWAQKRLEEVEKKKAHPNASVQTANGSPGRNLGNIRMRSKNYASPDCGAKIVAANPESRSARSILVSTRDEYMLNTCTSRVWFVVELCEAIQAKKIELANFELFSSSPKDLSVYVSDRFSTRGDWSIVGQFTARDERDVQSFSLQPHLFGKFIKVELHSHYGSEHFCPISLFRAYGTSEFEVLETETETELHDDNHGHESNTRGKIDASSDAESEDDDDEDAVFEDEEDSTSDRRGHLFGSARDAVISIVKKAAEVLVKNDDLKSDNETNTQENQSNDVLNDATINDCMTPAYNIICPECDDDNHFSRIFQLISCRRPYFESLLNAAFVRQILSRSHLCYDTEGRKNKNYDVQAQLFSLFFTSDYIIVLCNVLAVKENRLPMNMTRGDQQMTNRVPNETRMEQNSEMLLTTKDERFASTRPIDVVASFDSDKTKVQIPVIKSKVEAATESQTIENFATQIKPTKTTVLNDEVKKQSFDTNLESSRSQQSEDYEIYQYENSITTESPVPVVTKRISINSPKTSSGSQEHVQCSQEGASQQDVAILGTVSKSSQSLDSTQKLNQKSGNIELGEMESESVEEAEQKLKVDQTDQDSKTIMQDQLNFEGFDFKDLDVESLQNNGAAKNDASITQQTASATTPQQKESVFLRLSNRIKALERNMSLSSQYLEELSRRYKKQVEEMQRSLERAMTAMNEETRKGDEREYKRLEEVTVLHNQIDSLGKVLDDLIYERNSWRISFSSLMQHALFVFVDVILVILIFSYCKRTDNDLDYLGEEESEQTIVIKRPRGTNYEMAKQQCTQLTKKPKKRRPSEIASQVSGTYDQLMIEDSISINQLSRRDRRKKRKKDSIILRTSSIKETNSNGKGDGDFTSISTLPSRSSSANDALYTINHADDEVYFAKESHKYGRPGSAPDNSIDYFSNPLQNQQIQYDGKVQTINMDENHDETSNGNDMVSLGSQVLESTVLEDDLFIQVECSPSKNFIKPKKLSSPSFIKTALASRSKRISFSGGSKKKQSQSSDNNLIKSPNDKRCDGKIDLMAELENSNDAVDEHNNGRTTNGHVEESDESRSSSATPTANWNKKEKKSNGLKKMVRKFF
ncbi:PREDICTED: SUN domain-containing ossification factor [Ceratosolen solmsi marchali]|uniref:SUN domain-containing ossification factor n=1 Tax=Ceratosolen solmsi marchali TaxID=326594 RepID=A0AAJ6YKG2_9HYME|nr:PREDICTED: SUN domain-containing ossification factor [Ceratosolen solmsi marchali]